ncbi:sugar phosphate isomerase/epimerase family protein [Crateriforma conspicua]|uniref:sugar phosphate isomerase/epimerase family protein n=1 Tax=Crateriforma conspicua TaxID=2527996 RepID=UPI00118AA114|nr:sugar phosphate isomerase/epimerase family protein [Crateriforma conspicua]QDV62314.1 Inosose isomerase [Crateriforma conspicua]
MNHQRRRFLASSAGFLTASALTKSVLAQPSGRRRFTVDLRWGSIGVKASQREAIELAAKHGFESVAASPAELAKLSDSENQDLLGQLADAGLVWGSSGLPLDFRKDEARFQEGLRQLPTLAAAAQRAGVTRMGTWITPGSDELTYVANFRQHARRLRQCAKVLKDHGIRFGLEYVGTPSLRNSKRYPFIHTMRETADLHAEIGVDNMGFVLDSWHWYTARESADDIRALDSKQVVGCDLNDAPAGLDIEQQQDNQRELPMATGVIDVRSFLEALVDIGYDGPVRAEPFNKPLNQLDNDAACAKTSAAIHQAFALLD